jgi:release factor glutamine methyltransferase
LRVKVRLIDQRRYNRLALERVAGRPIVVLPEVFNPVLLRSGKLFAESLSASLIPPGARVLDMGTGSGVGAITAAQWASSVVAVDINLAAVRTARVNALLNGLEERVEAREGDLFEPLDGERFDVILFNPPFFRGEPKDALDRAWRSTDVVERFAAGLPNHLTPDGYALVLLSTHGVEEQFLDAFRAYRLAVDVVARRDLINEVLTIYRCRLSRIGMSQ